MKLIVRFRCSFNYGLIFHNLQYICICIYLFTEKSKMNKRIDVLETRTIINNIESSSNDFYIFLSIKEHDSL